MSAPLPPGLARSGRPADRSGGRFLALALILYALCLAILGALFVAYVVRAPLEIDKPGSGLRDIPSACFNAPDGRGFYRCIARPVK